MPSTSETATDADQPRADTVLFDVDGTLVDSTYHHAVAWQRAFHTHGMQAAMWRVHRAIGMGGDRLVTAVAGEDAERQHGDTLRTAWESEYDKVLPEVAGIPGAGDLLRELRRRGWTVALASSGKPRFTEAAIDLIGAADSVQGWTTSEDAQESKPAPDILTAALEAVGGRSAVVVGDATYDVDAAAAIGAPCIAVRTGGFSAAELRDAGAVLVVDSVQDLLGVLDDTVLAAPAG